jgi:hypothetical protein
MGQTKKKKVKNMNATDSEKVASRSIGEFFQERIEEFVETFNCMSRQTIDLCEKTLSVYQATSVPDAQRRVGDLIESSLTALRVNVHSAMKINARIIADWKEVVDGFGFAEK